MRIDSHQHFWDYDPSEYSWISPGSGIDVDCHPQTLLPLLREAGLDGCIAVQARQSLIENDFLCGLAEGADFVKGVVGWIDLRSPQVAEQAAQFASSKKSVGVRHVVQDEVDSNFMARETFRNGIRALADYGLVYDILIYEHQLQDAVELVRAFPDQPFVLDHIAKPNISGSRITSQQTVPWSEGMIELSKADNVWVKVSGVVTEADHKNWTPEQLRPYFERVVETFGPERLMFGSDWPVLNLASDYLGWVEMLTQWTVGFSQTESSRFWGETASQVYRLS